MAGSSNSESFDPRQPQRFYLPDEEMERLADATLIVEGVRLPVHSAVLSLQSRVLRGLFVDLFGSAPGVGTCKRKQPEEPVVLEQPFADCRLQEVAAFLRCTYDEHRLAAVPVSCLLGVLRLAHKLDASRALDAAGAHMSNATGQATTTELLAWADASDTYHLDELYASCYTELGRRLMTGLDGSLTTTITCTSLLEGCSQRSLLLLLRMMATAAANTLRGSQLPSKVALVEALQRAPNLGAFEWALERFSEQSAEVGDRVESPWFAAAGKEWRIHVYPGGAKGGNGRDLSVFLVPQATVRAKYKLTVVEQSGAASQSVKHSNNEPEEIPVTGWGWKNFMTLEQLRTRGFLANDRLVVRAEVEVVPE